MVCTSQRFFTPIAALLVVQSGVVPGALAQDGECGDGTIQATVPALSGLVAHWDGTVVDGVAVEAVAGRDGLLEGGAVVGVGASGTGLHFDGDSGAVVVPHDPALNVGTGDFTLAFWIRTVEPGFTRLLGKVSGSTSGGSPPQYHAYLTGGGQVIAKVADGGARISKTTSTPVNDGVWHHVAVTWVGAADDLRLYVDGVPDTGPIEHVGTVGALDPTGPFQIGRVAQEPSYFGGAMDEIALYGRALAPDEVTLAARLPESCDDGGRVDEDGCSSTCQREFCGDSVVQAGLDEACDDGGAAPGDGCDDRCLLECGNGALDAGEQCDDGNTMSGDGCTPSCRAERRCGDGVVAEGPGPKPAPVAWWDGSASGGLLLDVAGGHHGELRLGASIGEGFGGPGLVLDGLDDYVIVAHDPTLGFGTGDFTMEFWLRTTVPDFARILGKVSGTTSGGSPVQYHAYMASGGVRVKIADGSERITRQTGGSVNDGEWHHVAAIWRSATQALEVYTDGVEDSFLVERFVPIGALDPTGPFYLGRVADESSRFPGSLDEVGIYDRALTADEVVALASRAEECDDGNTASGDGCSDVCEVEPVVCTVEVCNGVDDDCDNEIDEVDDDGDGVNDCDADRCPETTADDAGSEGLRPNHYRFDGAAWVYNAGTTRSPRPAPAGFTLTETFGCSCDQILRCKPGQDFGQLRHGCTGGRGGAGEHGTLGVFRGERGWARTRCARD